MPTTAHYRTAALAFLCAGCRGDTASTETFVSRDSAGIAIVESLREAWTDSAEMWMVADTPRVEIGRTEGDPNYLLDRVTGVTRLPDGRIVIANRGSNELRFYDSTGVFLRTAGRSGEGPGEFSYLRGLGRCGADSLFAFDLNWQTSVFTADGELAREFIPREPGAEGGPYNLVCSPRGVVVISGWGRDSGPPPVGFYRSMTPVWVIDTEGREVGALGRHLGSERLGTPRGSRPHPFGRTTTFAPGADAIYLGSGEGLEVLRYAPDGRLTRIQRVPGADLTITDSLIGAYRARELENAPSAQRPELERTLLEMPMPPALPGLTALRLDDDGYLWARRFSAPGDARERWAVFSPAGSLLGHVAMPERFRLVEVGRSYVLGIAEDEDGVQRVRAYTLRR